MKVRHGGKIYQLVAKWSRVTFNLLKAEMPYGKVSVIEPPFALPIGELEVIEDEEY